MRTNLASGIAPICFAWMSLIPVFAQTAPADPNVVAVVSGRAISATEVQAAAQNQLRQLETQAYEAKRAALEDIINESVIREEAKRQGIPPEQLVLREADSKVVAPTEAEARAFYFAQADKGSQSFEEVRPQIDQALRRFKVQRERQVYVRQLREKASVAILLRPPRETVRVEDDTRVKGNREAPVTIVEFSDFECPFCQKAAPIALQVAHKYGADVRIAFRDFPLREKHPHAQLAAEASRCAADQNKFWEYHDVLFANPGKLDKTNLLAHARALNLDSAAFESCLDSGKHRASIEADVKDAIAAGVTGTPGFFVNGIFLNGAVPAAAFEKVIDEELAYIRYQRSAPIVH
jgi:protein-disulfide isomerase